MNASGIGKTAWMAGSLVVLATMLLTGHAAADDTEWKELVGEDYKQHWETEGNWIQENGVVSLKPRAGESGWSRWDAYLWSDREYTDFEIEFEYKPAENSNSGFYFRVGDRDDPVAQGIEVQIYDSHGKPEDKLTDHDSGGIIPGIPPTKNTANPTGEWSKFEIVNQDDQLTVKLNGEVVNEVDLSEDPLSSRPRTGYIGFQDHALPLSLRNIKIREL